MKIENAIISSDQIKLIQETFSTIEPSALIVAKTFYDKLFELDPSLEELFSEDITPQRKKLMDMIGFLVYNLNDFDKLVGLIKALGQRHSHCYGVQDSSYETAATAFLYALEDNVGNAWTMKAKTAWGNLFKLVANLMTNNNHVEESITK
ncbi:globin domain-containing protein [Flammeovirga aprica]|uniref:Hemin receptor n=1 Tax=Flammeovirga aprica JL-4 TaxID=694437 RepID=A0A7X9XAM8_9BACT|nr:globin domain-containing protein [Flammeovirga aprica]NME69779.1 hemin receptor [Flammeovirga aprica JL-4]